MQYGQVSETTLRTPLLPARTYYGHHLKGSEQGDFPLLESGVRDSRLPWNAQLRQSVARRAWATTPDQIAELFSDIFLSGILPSNRER